MKPMMTLLLALSVALAGCTLAPDYQRPAAPVADTWPVSAPAGANARPVAAIPWQEYFLAPQLRQVIDLALENSRDLRVAVLNIERFRAAYRIQRADLFPELDANASSSAQRVPAGSFGSNPATHIHEYNVGLGLAAYELDLFGRVRSLKEQALQQYLATAEARRSVQISLVAEVAGSYLSLAADRERLQLAQKTLKNQQEAFDLIERRYHAGVASALDLQRAKTSVETARVDIARYTALVAQDQNALNLVVGATVPKKLLPGSLDQNLTALTGIAPGLPSTVLLTRPDILQAEHQLQAANANIGAARAAFFPRITLTGNLGTGSAELSGLFSGGSLTWSFVPQVALPIFDAGRNRADLDVAKVDHKIAVAQYEKAIQTAFREVADALAQRATIDQQVAAQQALTAADVASYRLSKARYDKGVDSYLSVLDAQRALYGAQQNLIGVRFSRLANQLNFYKALGGGST